MADRDWLEIKHSIRKIYKPEKYLTSLFSWLTFQPLLYQTKSHRPVRTSYKWYQENSPRENTHPKNSHPSNSPLGNCPPENSHPENSHPYFQTFCFFIIITVIMYFFLLKRVKFDLMRCIKKKLQLACYSGNVLDMMEMFSIFSFRKCSTLVKSGRAKKKFPKNPKKPVKNFSPCLKLL